MGEEHLNELDRIMQEYCETNQYQALDQEVQALLDEEDGDGDEDGDWDDEDDEDVGGDD